MARLGYIDEAIAALPSIGQGAIAETGPSFLAREIVAALESTQTWTAARAEALVTALAEARATDPETLLQALGSAWRHLVDPANALARLRAAAAGDEVGGLELASGIGLLRAGDQAAAEQHLARGVEHALARRPRQLSPVLVFRCLRELAATGSPLAAPLLVRSYRLFQAGDSATPQQLREVMAGVTEPELDGAFEGLTRLPAALAEPARDVLARALATRLVGAAQSRQRSLELVLAAPDLVSAERRAVWLAIAWLPSDRELAQTLIQASRVLEP